MEYSENVIKEGERLIRVYLKSDALENVIHAHRLAIDTCNDIVKRNDEKKSFYYEVKEYLEDVLINTYW